MSRFLFALFLALALFACGGTQRRECFECGLTDEWARADAERKAEAERKAHPALSGLAALPVRPANSEGYDRSAWKHWVDEDKDCQDTRQEVLIAESLIPVTFKTERSCKVASGKWRCPYTGLTFTNPSKLDVDHMVPLAAAHQAGGYAWSADDRSRFANDLGFDNHLIAVSASANRQKGKKDPAEWLPSIDTYVCQYLSDWVGIKARYRLSVSAKEKAAITARLERCDP